METKANYLSEEKLWLLPNVCKRIGIGLFVVTLVFALVLKLTTTAGDFLSNRYTLKSIVISLSVLSAVLVIFSREKIETAEVRKRRKTAFIIATISAVIFLLLELFFEYWRWPADNSLVGKILFQYTMFYLINFYVIRFEVKRS